MLFRFLQREKKKYDNTGLTGRKKKKIPKGRVDFYTVSCF